MRRLGIVCLGLLVAGIVAGTLAWPRWIAIRDAADALVDRHVGHEVAHPGWSFPAHVWSAAAPLDQDPARLVEEAHVRGYADACPPKHPGEICPTSAQVMLRGGTFPEGVQPAGNAGWTRPLALEPVLVGTLIGPDAEEREHLPLAQAPPALIAAIIAAEDQDFWTHPGVNPRGLLRAALVDLQGSGAQQGASTLTMQVVRNLSQDKERTLGRKAREALSAIAIDAHLGKEGVLQVYLDAPYLGQDGSTSICGFQAAAMHYWGVDARDLSLAQAATLAAILPAPGRWAPDVDPVEATARRDHLLRSMAGLGWDRAAVDAALQEPMGGLPPAATPAVDGRPASRHGPPPPRWPAYLQATRSWLADQLPPEILYGAGLDVFTALDPLAQEVGDRVLPEGVAFLAKNVPRNGKEPLEAAAALIDVHSGLLVAVFDGRMAAATDFNRATQTLRQAGSSVKPLIYALALSKLGPDGHPALTQAYTLPNEPRTFPGTNGWRPLNVGDDYSPTSTLAMGLSWSQNIVAASLLEQSGGPRALIAFANRIGFDTRAWPVEMGLALGQGEVNPLEMSRLSATIARGGIVASGRPVIVVKDAAGRIRIPEPEPSARVMPEESAALVRDLMRLVTTYGTGYTVKGVAGRDGYALPSMGKTGTSDDEKDVWFTGATPRYAGAIWLGYETPARVGGTAGDLAAPLWGWWMHALHAHQPAGSFVGPELERHPICTQTGLYPNPSCRIINAYFLPGTAPRGSCSVAHPPPPPDKKPFENLWQRKARATTEKENPGAGPGD